MYSFSFVSDDFRHGNLKNRNPILDSEFNVQVNKFAVLAFCRTRWRIQKIYRRFLKKSFLPKVAFMYDSGEMVK